MSVDPGEGYRLLTDGEPIPFVVDYYWQGSWIERVPDGRSGKPWNAENCLPMRVKEYAGESISTSGPYVAIEVHRAALAEIERMKAVIQKVIGGHWSVTELQEAIGLFKHATPELEAVKQTQPDPEPEWFDLTPFGEHSLRKDIDLYEKNRDDVWLPICVYDGATIDAMKNIWGRDQRFRCLLRDAPPELVAKTSGLAKAKEVVESLPESQRNILVASAMASKPTEDPDEWVTQDRVDERLCDQRRFLHVWSGGTGYWYDGEISGKRHGYEYTSGYKLELRCRRRDLPPMPEQKPKTETWHEIIVNVTHYGLPVCAWTKELKPDDEPTGRTIVREVVR